MKRALYLCFVGVSISFIIFTIVVITCNKTKLYYWESISPNEDYTLIIRSMYNNKYDSRYGFYIIPKCANYTADDVEPIFYFDECNSVHSIRWENDSTFELTVNCGDHYIMFLFSIDGG